MTAHVASSISSFPPLPLGALSEAMASLPLFLVVRAGDRTTNRLVFADVRARDKAYA